MRLTKNNLREKLMAYEQAFTKLVKAQYPFSEIVCHNLKDIQFALNLRDEEVSTVELSILSQLKLKPVAGLTCYQDLDRLEIKSNLYSQDLFSSSCSSESKSNRVLKTQQEFYQPLIFETEDSRQSSNKTFSFNQVNFSEGNKVSQAFTTTNIFKFAAFLLIL